jgi:hypothetical protein
MASVAVVFLLLMAVFMLMTAQLVKKARNDAARYQVALKEAKQESIGEAKSLVDRLLGLQLVKENKAKVQYDEKQDPFLIVLVVQEKHLSFLSGECSLQQPNEVRRLLRPVFEAVCREVASVQSITLEGHTSMKGFCPAATKCGAEPCRPQAWELDGFANNVRLSAARAQNVYLEMRKELEVDRALLDCVDDQFVVAGRGPVQPANNLAWRDVTRGDDADDRRVVMKIRMKSDKVLNMLK